MEALTTHTIKTVQRTGYPYFLITEKEQRGGSFGARFCNAVQEVFNKGFDALIIIGNDSPGLSCSHLLRAAEALQKGKLALGPSADGGFYLMGLQKCWFDRGVFESLPWQMANLTSAIKEVLIPQTGDLCLLPALADLDQASDLKRLLRNFQNIPSGIIKLIQELLAHSNHYWDERRFRVNAVLIASHYNKGSPESML